MTTFQRDLTERIVRTFAQAALAVVATDFAGVTDLNSAKAIGVAAVAAGISAVVGLVAKNLGDPDSASVLTK